MNKIKRERERVNPELYYFNSFVCDNKYLLLTN